MIITVGNEKGGVGKTRLATHIACLAACSNLEVVLLDTDRQGSSTGWSRIRAEEGVEPHFPVLTLPNKPVNELQNLSSKYDLLVVDVGAQNYQNLFECAFLSDIVIVPCGRDQAELESTLSVFESFKTMGARHEKGKIPAHVVLTRVHPNPEHHETLGAREYFKEEGISVFDATTVSRQAWLTSGKTGRALHEIKGRERDPKAIKEMQAVYDEILQRISE